MIEAPFSASTREILPQARAAWTCPIPSSGITRARLAKRATRHTLRYSFATHRLESGYDSRTVRELLAHRDVGATMICTDVLTRGGLRSGAARRR